MGVGSWPVGVLVLIVESGNLPGIDPDLVAAILGFTPAEGRVSVLLAEGRAVHNIAATIGCQENTVLYHVKQMHRKLGISRRAELVRLVMSLAGHSDFHRLHWHQFAWRTVIPPFSATDPHPSARVVKKALAPKPPRDASGCSVFFPRR